MAASTCPLPQSLLRMEHWLPSDWVVHSVFNLLAPGWPCDCLDPYGTTEVIACAFQDYVTGISCSPFHLILSESSHHAMRNWKPQGRAICKCFSWESTLTTQVEVRRPSEDYRCGHNLTIITWEAGYGGSWLSSQHFVRLRWEDHEVKSARPAWPTLKTLSLLKMQKI